MKPLMLCVCMDPGRVMRISMIAAALGIAVREAKEDQAGQRLDALCGLAASKTAAPKGKIGEEMMVLAFFPDRLMDALFGAIRKNGMERPRLTAVLTPANRSWTLEKLYRELKEEAAALGRRS